MSNNIENTIINTENIENTIINTENIENTIINKENKKYIKMDDNTCINKKYIRWIKQMNDCLEVCVKSNGCDRFQTHRVCVSNNPDSFMKLREYIKIED